MAVMRDGGTFANVLSKRSWLQQISLDKKPPKVQESFVQPVSAGLTRGSEPLVVSLPFCMLF